MFQSATPGVVGGVAGGCLGGCGIDEGRRGANGPVERGATVGAGWGGGALTGAA